MKSLRLLAIASLIDNGSSVLDVGTDHAYLPINLSQNKKCKSIIASDVSSNALKIAKDNLKKYHINDVKLILSDGLDSINEDYDTIVLAGMGTSTIIKILENKKLPNNLIISSNNDLYKLRNFMNSIGYKIINEIIVYENKKFYDIIKYQKGKEKLSYYKKMYGKSNDKNYFKYLLEKDKLIYAKVKFFNKISLLKNIIYLYLKSI
ncbi:MAG: class I SAM-dependent methyltransferase [bacterium]|nr:class I SAM-dependent methyltransferase [bacterium]